MPTPQVPGVRTRVTVALLEAGVAAMTLPDIAKITGVSIAQAHRAVIELRNQQLVIGKNRAISLTARGEDYALRNRDLATKRPR